jgi:hypothetical protein
LAREIGANNVNAELQTGNACASLVASDCDFQPRVLPTGGWEAAVTGTLEACLYTAKARWLATLFVKGIIPFLGKKLV